MGEKLDLTRKVDENVLACALLGQLLLQPIEVLFDVLHAVDEPAIRAEVKLVHGVLEADELHDVDRALVGQKVVSRVQVHHHGLPPC